VQLVLDPAGSTDWCGESTSRGTVGDDQLLLQLPGEQDPTGPPRFSAGTALAGLPCPAARHRAGVQGACLPLKRQAEAVSGAPSRAEAARIPARLLRPWAGGLHRSAFPAKSLGAALDQPRGAASPKEPLRPSNSRSCSRGERRVVGFSMNRAAPHAGFLVYRGGSKHNWPRAGRHLASPSRAVKPRPTHQTLRQWRRWASCWTVASISEAKRRPGEFAAAAFAGGAGQHHRHWQPPRGRGPRVQLREARFPCRSGSSRFRTVRAHPRGWNVAAAASRPSPAWPSVAGVHGGCLPAARLWWRCTRLALSTPCSTWRSYAA